MLNFWSIIIKVVEQNDFFHPALIKKINDGKWKNFDDNFGSNYDLFILTWITDESSVLYWI